MCELGNTAINKIYEARIDEITIKKPHPSNPRYSMCLYSNNRKPQKCAYDYSGGQNY